MSPKEKRKFRKHNSHKAKLCSTTSSSQKRLIFKVIPAPIIESQISEGRHLNKSPKNEEKKEESSNLNINKEDQKEQTKIEEKKQKEGIFVPFNPEPMEEEESIVNQDTNHSEVQQIPAVYPNPPPKIINNEKEFSEYYGSMQKKISDVYAKDVFHHRFERDIYREINENFLSKHKLTELQREKVVWYLLNLSKTIKLEPRTLFIGINIMDYFLERSENKTISLNELETIGLTSLVLASKFNSVCPITFAALFEDGSILKGKKKKEKFNEEQLSKLEIEILETLNLNITSCTSFDYITEIISDLNSNNYEIFQNEEMKNSLNNLKKWSFIFSKFCLLNEKFSRPKPILISIACLYCALNIMASPSSDTVPLFIELAQIYLAKVLTGLKLNQNEIISIQANIVSFFESFRHNKKDFDISLFYQD
ncbi:MAG: hypothetical protein MJ252_08230 [archaeon]|nr:hypothetical protein [archaeon]